MIITISRQLGSQGGEVARKIADKLSCRLIDKESVEAILHRHGVLKESVERFDERKPRFWDRLQASTEMYKDYLTLAMLSFAIEGDCVIIGRGGQRIFAELPNAFRVRVVRPYEGRLETVRKTLNTTEADAERAIRSSDHDRAGFHRFFFHSDLNDSQQFDLVLNMAKHDTGGAAGLILQAAEWAHVRHHDLESLPRLRDLHLREKVNTTINYRAGIPTAAFDLDVVDGVLYVRGDSTIERHVRRCEEAAQRIEGVKRVEVELTYNYSHPSLRM